VVPLIARWNGRRWKSVDVPLPDAGAGILEGVSAVSRTDVWAVGETCPSCAQDHTLAYHWNGHKWWLAMTPDPTDFAALRAVSAASARNVWAVGDSFNGSATQSLTMHWNGRKWKTVASPDPAGASNQTILFGVSIRTGKDAWSVGKYYEGNATVSLALHWDGTAWTQVKTKNPSTTNDSLAAVTAVSKRDVWAVGETVSSAPAGQTLVEHWNGTRWKLVASPDPGGPDQLNALNGVAALSRSKIWAVGTGTDTDAEVGRALAIALP
jgi:hypothetical protein